MQFAQAAMVVYDATRPETFKAAQTWVDEVVQIGEKDMFVMLVGMKCDLIDESTEAHVTEAEAVEYANQKLISAYPLCSAKNGEGIEDVFLDLAESMHERRLKSGATSHGSLDESFAAEDEEHNPYGFATRATTLSRAKRKESSAFEDIGVRFSGCLSCLNACFSETVTKGQEIAVNTRIAFQSMSEQVDQKTRQARKSLSLKDWRVKRNVENRNAELIVRVKEAEEQLQLEQLEPQEEGGVTPTNYEPVVTSKPLKG